MEIIVSHDLTDLDGLAAMIAAGKLYPAARPVFVGRQHQMVRDFMALYRDEIRVWNYQEIDPAEVERVIVVDTFSRERLGKLNQEINWEEVEVIVYDHHSHEEIGWADLDLSQSLGSSTTILINRIKAEEIALNPAEATLFALGIYADTGNFTHLTTRPEDLRAAAYLLDYGANIKIINQFLEDRLTLEQKKALENLIPARQDVEIKGQEISLFTASLETYVLGLNKVITRLKELYNLKTVFLLVEMEGSVLLIGRSNSESVDIGSICSRFSGGGHSGAGSARLDSPLSQARSRLMQVLKEEIKTADTVESIMTSPVHTIKPDTSVAEAERIMDSYGHNGLIVEEDGEIKGVFSRRDLDKIKGHDLMNAPVKGYMTRDVITIDCGATIQEAQEKMVKNNIGRLPVMLDDSMVGIVTRTDILASYFERKSPQYYQNRYGSSMVKINNQTLDIRERLKFFPGRVRKILQTSSRLARELDIRVFLIGGMVRDLLLGRQNRDLDLVVDGAAEAFLTRLSAELGRAYKYNERFQTGSISLKDNYTLDVARTRSEHYPGPGSLPEVESAGILEDLFRRDFTINALALALYPEEYGYLHDYFNGRQDLERGLVRVLHRFSFLDDPTRIIRGVRQALALNFQIEPETENLMNEALRRGDFSRLSLNRVYKELSPMIKNHHANPRLPDMLYELPVFKLLNYNFEFSAQCRKEWNKLEDSLDYLARRDYNVKEWEVKLIWLLRDLPEEYMDKLNISGGKRELMNYARCSREHFQEFNKLKDPLAIVDYLDQLPPEKLALLYFAGLLEGDTAGLDNYFSELKDIEIEIDGNDLIDLGLKPGPEIKEVLDKIRQARFNNRVKNREEELELAEKLITSRNYAEEIENDR